MRRHRGLPVAGVTRRLLGWRRNSGATERPKSDRYGGVQGSANEDADGLPRRTKSLRKPSVVRTECDSPLLVTTPEVGNRPVNALSEQAALSSMHDGILGCFRQGNSNCTYNREFGTSPVRNKWQTRTLMSRSLMA